ncbi:MAG: hypothetical protein R3B82_05715 [Sandaracinaceae bacterium]
MEALDRARALLERHRVADRVAEVAAAEAKLREAHAAWAEADRSSPYWHRGDPTWVATAKADLEVRRAAFDAERAALARAREARDEAVKACAAEAPPIGVVHAIAQATEALLRDRAAGRFVADGVPHATHLDAIATHVLDVWAPGVDLAGLVDRLHYAPLGPTTAPGPIATHPVLAWAPVAEAELLARAAHALVEGGELAAAREALHGTRHRMDGLIAALADAEKRVDWVDRLMPGVNSPEEQDRNDYAGALGAERHAHLTAIERSYLAVVQALSRHPAIWIALACRAAAAALRAAGGAEERVLEPDGHLVAAPSPYARAVALAALVEARRACDAAFRGLSGSIWPRSSAPAPRGADAGPYRVREVAPRAPLLKGRTEASQELFQALEGSSVRGDLAWAVAHATVLGVVDAAHGATQARIGWLDRAIFWSDTDDEARERVLEGRQRWLRAALKWRGVQAVTALEHVAERHPLLQIGRGLAATQAAIAAIGTDPGRSGRPRVCSVLRTAPALEPLDAAQRLLAHHLGGFAGREAIVARVCERIERASGPLTPPASAPLTVEELEQLLAAQLQRTPFAAAVREIQALRPRADAADQRARAADAQVSSLDRLNVFTDSPEERARDEARGEAADARSRIVALRAQAVQLYRDAVRAHPPSWVASLGDDVRDAIQSIYARNQRRSSGSGNNRSTYYVCVLEGRVDAVAAAATWAREVMSGLGGFPGAGDLLVEWVAEELR